MGRIENRADVTGTLDSVIGVWSPDNARLLSLEEDSVHNMRTMCGIICLGWDDPWESVVFGFEDKGSHLEMK